MSSVSVTHGPDQTPLRLRRITAGEFWRMVEEGIIREGERVELIGGMIVEMSPSGKRHLGVLHRLNEALRFNRQVSVGVQYTMQFDDETVVDPDLVLMRPDADPGQGVRPDDVLLLIEVADTSLRTDRGEKALRYARAGIPEYWIVDVEGRRVLVLREPGDSGYAREDDLGPTAEAHATFAPGVTVRVADLFPDPGP